MNMRKINLLSFAAIDDSKAFINKRQSKFKKMDIKKHILIYIILVLTIMSCYKDDIVIVNTKISSKKHLPIEISGDIVGIVQDEFGNPVSDYSCSFMNQDYISFYNGYYHFNAINANKNGTIIQINKNNRNYQFTLKPLNNDVNYFSHTIFTKPLKTVKNSNQIIEINPSNDINIVFKENAFQNPEGDYTGEVSIEAFSPDLSNPVQTKALPGDHLAINNKNEEVWIDIYSAFFIDIRDKDDNELQVKNQYSEATINNALLTCSDCAVWYYDKNKSKWIEHTQTDKLDNVEFDILQSGFYCYAKPYIYNLVEGQISGENTPLRNQPLDIYDESGRYIERVFTTNSGKWFTHLPMNKKYNYKFSINKNDTFSREFELGEIDNNELPVFELNNVSIVQLTGEIRDCNDKLIDNSFFQLWKDNGYKCLFLTKSKVNLNVVSMTNNPVYLQSADESWLDIGPRQSFLKIKNKINFDKSYSCSQFKKDGYFKIIIDDKEKLLSPPVATIENGRTKLEIADINNMRLDTKIEIYISGQEERQYNDTELNIYIENLILGEKKYELNCKNSSEGCGFEKFEIENFGKNKGDWIKGNFSGTFWVKTFNPLKAEYKKINAKFLVQRNFR